MSEMGIRPCEFKINGQRCCDTDTRRYDVFDGSEVWLCIKHRGWLPALGTRIDGEACS